MRYAIHLGLSIILTAYPYVALAADAVNKQNPQPVTKEQPFNPTTTALPNASPSIKNASKSGEPTLDDKFNQIESASSSSDMIDVEADNLNYEGDIAYADGDVVISYKDATIKTASATVNQKEKTAFGNDPFEMSYIGESGGKETITGKKLDYNFKNKVGSFENSLLVQNAANPKQKLYIIADKLTSENRKTYRFDGSYITTCRYFEGDRHEHYHLWAATGLYAPKKQLVLFNVILYIGSTPVFYTPIWYISLRKRQFISIGSNNVEGQFIKSGLEYELDDNNYGLLLNDNMSIKGWGSGLEHTYTDNKNTNFTGMFWQLHEQDTGLNSYKYKISYNTKFGDNVSNSFTVNDNNTYTLGFGRDDRATYSDAWSYTKEQTNLSLGYNQTINNRTTQPINNLNNTLSLSTPIAPMTILSVQGNQSYNSFSQDNIITNTNTINNTQEWGSISFSNSRYYDTSASAAALYLGRSFIDSDSLKVAYNKMQIDGRPITNSATFSSITDKVSNKQAVLGKALYYDMTIGAKPIYIFGLQQLNFDIANSGWKQAVYDSGDAQYSIMENYSLINKLSQSFTFSTTYHKDNLSPLNNTPFISADRLYTATQYIRSTMTIASSTGDFNYSWNTTGGYNYLTKLSDPVNHNISFNIGKRQSYTMQFGTDTNTHKQLPLTFSGNIRSNDTGLFSDFGDEKIESAWVFGFSGSIDPNKNILNSLSNNLTYDYGSSWIDHIRLSYTGTFDNYTQLYSISSISIIKDFHDMQVTFSYQPLGQTYMFEMKSIAFPQGSATITQSPQFGTSYGVGGVTIPR